MASGRQGTPSTGRVIAVAVVDVGLIVAVLAWGLHTHAVDPVRSPVYTARTVVPFLVGWVIWAPIVGAYGGRALGSPRRGLAISVLAWVAAAVTGAGIRATPLVPGDAPWIFVAVIAGVGTAVLVPWRALVCLSARA